MALSPNSSQKSKTYRKRVNSPIPQVDKLIQAVDAIHPSPRLPADVLSDYRSTLRKLKRWAIHIKRLNVRRDAMATTIKWQLRNGARLAQTHDIDKQLAWLLDRKHRGGNVHAMALGKLGAAARWHKPRVPLDGDTLPVHPLLPK